VGRGVTALEGAEMLATRLMARGFVCYFQVSVAGKKLRLK
jgi:hypothetical protein